MGWGIVIQLLKTDPKAVVGLFIHVHVHNISDTADRILFFQIKVIIHPVIGPGWSDCNYRSIQGEQTRAASNEQK